ncbi:hypothetical protein [uncultured Roseibium sp.]|uniref:hypothetical protein n=1 Tax=uncultured Roseibium sp. TaxID=1936171 RepID=UPI00260A6457|nr:hypothetical protein [uncultured Roseibium sp.]
MNDIDPLLNADDRFVLGNVALMAVTHGFGGEIADIVELLKEEDPTDASACLLEAVYLDSIGDAETALETLESFNVFETQNGREDAIAFHLHLVAKLGHVERARDLGKAYIRDGDIQKESARHMVVATLNTLRRPGTDRRFETRNSKMRGQNEDEVSYGND